jgi:hypothetical protein
MVYTYTHTHTHTHTHTQVIIQKWRADDDETALRDNSTSISDGVLYHQARPCVYVCMCMYVCVCVCV